MFLRDALSWWDSVSPKDREYLWSWYCGVKQTRAMDSTELHSWEINEIYYLKGYPEC